LADSENEENKDHIETTNIMEELSTLFERKKRRNSSEWNERFSRSWNSQEDISQSGPSGFSKRLKRKH